MCCCCAVQNVSRRFGWGLGMTQVAKSDHSTQNHVYASYVMRSQQMVFVFTAPYGDTALGGVAANDNATPANGDAHTTDNHGAPHPGFNPVRPSALPWHDVLETHARWRYDHVLTPLLSLNFLGRSGSGQCVLHEAWPGREGHWH